MRSLPDLDLHTAADDADPHRREQVVCGVAVVVHAAVEHGRGILADAGLDHGLAARVVVDEVRDIMDYTSDGDEATAVAGLVNVVVPFHDGELLERHAPVEPCAVLVELLLHLLEAALLDLIGTELLEVIGEAELLANPDEPLGRVVLVPLDGVTVVGRELVVEVVIALAESDECRDHVVAGAVAVIEWLIAEPVGKRVDAESGLLHEEDTQDARVDETTKPVVPTDSRDQGREDQAHEEDDLDVVLVLPDDDLVIIEIGDVGAANALRVLLHDHPANVGVEKSLPDAIRILVGVGVAVMGSVIARPPSD